MLGGGIGQQVQRPGAPGLTEATRGLVEDALERVGLGLIADRLPVLGSTLLPGRAARALLFEGAEGVVDGPDGAAEVRGDPGRSLALGTGQEDPGAPGRERPAAPKPRLERPTLGIGQRPNERGWLHDTLFATNHRFPNNRMRPH